MNKRKAIILCAPSGSGKTTIVKHLLSKNKELSFSISACTRDKRGRNEENGKDYYFLKPEEFNKKVLNNEFIEWEQVYDGSFYGTLKSEVERLWSEGKNVIFDVDAKGGLALKKYFGDDALSIFVKVPSKEIIERRLRERGTDNEESISKRLFKIEFELGFEKEFDVSLMNDDLETTLKSAQIIYKDFIENGIPKKQVRVGLSAMIIRDNKILLGKRLGSHGEGEWALVGGHMEYGEDFKSSLAREVDEETGMILKNITLLRVSNILEYVPKHYVDLCFIAECVGVPELKEPHKCEGWYWFSPDELPKNLFSSLKSTIEYAIEKNYLKV